MLSRLWLKDLCQYGMGGGGEGIYLWRELGRESRFQNRPISNQSDQKTKKKKKIPSNISASPLLKSE